MKTLDSEPYYIASFPFSQYSWNCSDNRRSHTKYFGWWMWLAG